MKTKTKTTTKPAAPPAKPNPVHYVSFNFEELAALEQLGFRERWAYIVFKSIANFKTGMVGIHKRQRLTYVGLAEAFRPPPGKQGRGEGGIDDTQMRDFMTRMEAAGLLIRHPNRADNGGLRFELPMSPIDRKTAAGAPVLPGPSPVISPTETDPESAGNDALVRVPEVLTPTPSVMNFKDLNINTEGLDPEQGPAPRRASGAPLLLEDPAASAGHGPACWVPLAAPGAPQPLTAAAIRDELGASWDFDPTACDAPDSWRLYEAWAGNGLTRDDLHAAMIGAEELTPDRPLTPQHLAGRWRPSPGQSNASRSAA